MVPVGEIFTFISFVLTIVLFFIIIAKMAEMENHIKWLRSDFDRLHGQFNKIIRLINGRRDIRHD